MNRMILGLVLLGVVAAAAIAATQFDLSGVMQRASPRSPVTVSVFCDGEKSALLANPKVASIPKDRYRVTLDATKVGVVEMSTTLGSTGKDCLRPSYGGVGRGGQGGGQDGDCRAEYLQHSHRAVREVECGGSRPTLRNRTPV